MTLAQLGSVLSAVKGVPIIVSERERETERERVDSFLVSVKIAPASLSMPRTNHWNYQNDHYSCLF
jgi:hypothetical protein